MELAWLWGLVRPIAEALGIDAARAAVGALGRRLGRREPHPDRLQPSTGLLPSVVRGRDRMLRGLETAIRRPGGPAIVLAGVGGIGKSTVARAVSQWARRHGRSVWWLSGVDATSLGRDTNTLARALGATEVDLAAVRSGAEDAPDVIWSLLERSPARWLLVIDNADDPRLLQTPGGRSWLRRTSRGLVLVTSRCADPWWWGSDAEVRRVDLLPAGEAALVLRDLAPVAGDQAAAERLAERLGGLALALHAAGSYLGSKFVRHESFDDYSHALDAVGPNRTFAPDPGRPDADDRSNLLRTWEISLDALAASGAPQARRLLRVLACYAPTRPFPVDLLRDPSVARLPGWRSREPSASDVDALVEQGLRALERVGLVDAVDARDTPSGQEWFVTVHPVIADTSRVQLIRPSLRRDGGVAVVGVAIDILARAASGLAIDRADDRERWRQVTPHVYALLAWATDLVDEAHLESLLDVAVLAARSAVWARTEAIAEDLTRVALAATDRLGNAHPATLRVRHARATAVMWQERWAEAAHELEELLTDVTAALGEDHAETLDVHNDLAWAVGNHRSWPDAVRRFEGVRQRRTAVLGADHPDLMHTVCRLGWAYSEVGRLSEARGTLAELADLRAERLGRDHRDSLDTREALIKVIMKQGEQALAEAMLQQLQRDRAAYLGERDRDTLETVRLRAVTLAALGRRRDARRLLTRLLPVQEQVLGGQHHDVVKVREHLRALSQQPWYT